MLETEELIEARLSEKREEKRLLKDDANADDGSVAEIEGDCVPVNNTAEDENDCGGIVCEPEANADEIAVPTWETSEDDSMLLLPCWREVATTVEGDAGSRDAEEKETALDPAELEAPNNDNELAIVD